VDSDSVVIMSGMMENLKRFALTLWVGVKIRESKRECTKECGKECKIEWKKKCAKAIFIERLEGGGKINFTCY
jgi:hypothetical protein